MVTGGAVVGFETIVFFIAGVVVRVVEATDVNAALVVIVMSMTGSVIIVVVSAGVGNGVGVVGVVGVAVVVLTCAGFEDGITVAVWCDMLWMSASGDCKNEAAQQSVVMRSGVGHVVIVMGSGLGGNCMLVVWAIVIIVSVVGVQCIGGVWGLQG